MPHQSHSHWFDQYHCFNVQ